MNYWEKIRWRSKRWRYYPIWRYLCYGTLRYLYVSYKLYCCCKQCSGSGIRCLFDHWIRDPGCVKYQDPGFGSGIRIRVFNPKSYFRELKKQYTKILVYFDEDTGSGMKNIRIRDGKHWDPGWKNSDPGQTSRIRNTACKHDILCR